MLANFELPKFNQISTLIGHLVRMLAILLVAWISTSIIRRWFPHMRARIVSHMVAQRGGSDVELEKRAATISGILRKTLAVLIWIVAVIMALKEAGFDIASDSCGRRHCRFGCGLWRAESCARHYFRHVYAAGESDSRERRGDSQRHGRTGGSHQHAHDGAARD